MPSFPETSSSPAHRLTDSIITFKRLGKIFISHNTHTPEEIISVYYLLDELLHNFITLSYNFERLLKKRGCP